jgi:hypothetical protein
VRVNVKLQLRYDFSFVGHLHAVTSKRSTNHKRRFRRTRATNIDATSAVRNRDNSGWGAQQSSNLKRFENGGPIINEFHSLLSIS